MLNRRHLLKLGLLGGSASLVPTRTVFGRAGVFRQPLASPATTPFAAPLPVPPTAQTVTPFNHRGCPSTTPPQVGGQGVPRPRWSKNVRPTNYLNPGTPPPPVDGNFYRLVEEEYPVSLHPDLPLTPVWRYRDWNTTPADPSAVGPTFKVNMNDHQVVRVLNRLPRNHVGFGLTDTSLHLHGGHTEARSDGFPESIPGFAATFGPGKIYDYCYAMRDPGFSNGTVDTGERPSTLWYHDHTADFTGQNSVRGLAGFFLVFDDLDTGDETTGLQLPSGDFDVPMVFADRLLNMDGSLDYDPFNHIGFLGDKYLVNGAINPFLDVKRRKYRFRLLNGSNARYYYLVLADSMGNTYNFQQIATEGGLLRFPITTDHAWIAPAERIEIVVDFSQFTQGTELFFEDRMDMIDGRGPSGNFASPGVLASGPQVMKFNVGISCPDPSLVPSSLRPFAVIPPAEIAAAPQKTFDFQRIAGSWAVNLTFWDPMTAITSVPCNTGERWTLRNTSPTWWHPIHIHLEHMRILSRNGGTPPLTEQDGVGRKDTVVLGPSDEVEVFVRFRDYKGPFVFHCHHLEHEDMFMMARYDVV